jgi:hypothetical protein
MSRMGEHAMETQTYYEPVEVSPLGNIAKALAAAQAEMANPRFDSSNPHFRNNFASLASVRNAVVPVLAKHGICMTQDIQTVEKGIACTTILTHASGQQMRFGPLVMPASKPDAQGFGSAATYARRYSLMAVAGVVGDDDDDANAASGKPAPAVAVNAGKGIGVHNPLGDVAIDDRAVKYADAFKEALEGGDVRAVAADMREEDGHEELYRATWSLLDSKARSAIKRILAEKAA